jgi:lantibiotic modifying enzyme
VKLQLEKKLQEISTVLIREYKQDNNIGVLSGASGIALFFFYYSKYLDIDTYADIGIKILEDIINRINDGYQYPTYCIGIAGAGWVFEHLFEEDFLDANNDELLPELDNYLVGIMNFEMQNGNYDFLHAGIGYGYYFLKRFQNTKNSDLKERYRDYLTNMVLLLNKTAEKDTKGIKWQSIINKETEELKGYNLSLSHGMSSIIIFLAKLHKIDNFKVSVTPLLKGAINYIQNQEIKDQNSFCSYPSWVTTQNTDKNKSRLAWCYGDLGIGLAFWHASKTLNDKNLKNKALEILLSATNRKLIEDTLVKDAGVCHGSFGNTQIFNYMYQETNNIIFKNAATYWIDKGLKMAIYKDGYAGYKQSIGVGGNEKWSPEISLLEGVAGIGLTIIDYLANYKNSWDECLMIS